MKPANESTPPAKLQRFMRKARVLEMCDLKQSTMYSMIAADQFPAPIAISPKVTVWLKSSILEWQQRVIAECKKVPAPQRKQVRAEEAEVEA